MPHAHVERNSYPRAVHELRPALSSNRRCTDPVVSYSRNGLTAQISPCRSRDTSASLPLTVHVGAFPRGSGRSLFLDVTAMLSGNSAAAGAKFYEVTLMARKVIASGGQLKVKFEPVLRITWLEKKL